MKDNDNLMTTDHSLSGILIDAATSTNGEVFRNTTKNLAVKNLSSIFQMFLPGFKSERPPKQTPNANGRNLSQ